VQRHPAIDQERLRPGMKILFPAGTAVFGGFILFDASAKLIGGHVKTLVENWELQQSMARLQRTGGGDEQPPPFVAFSQVCPGPPNTAK
jgi:hypothetical protein